MHLFSFSSLLSFPSFKEAALIEGFLPPHGGYKELLSYKKAQIVYDATVSALRSPCT